MNFKLRKWYEPIRLKALESLAQGNALWDENAILLSPARATSFLITPLQGFLGRCHLIRRALPYANGLCPFRATVIGNQYEQKYHQPN